MTQLFTAKSWTASSVDLNLGLCWNLKGIEFRPLPAQKDFAIHNICLRGKKMSFVRKGAGKNVSLSYANKKSDVPFIPWEELQDGMVVLLEME
jgi:hypothetical protein